MKAKFKISKLNYETLLSTKCVERYRSCFLYFILRALITGSTVHVKDSRIQKNISVYGCDKNSEAQTGIAGVQNPIANKKFNNKQKNNNKNGFYDSKQI